MLFCFKVTCCCFLVLFGKKGFVAIYTALFQNRFGRVLRIFMRRKMEGVLFDVETLNVDHFLLSCVALTLSVALTLEVSNL